MSKASIQGTDDFEVAEGWCQDEGADDFEVAEGWARDEGSDDLQVADGWDLQADKYNRWPLKQRLPILCEAADPRVRQWAEYQVRSQERTEQRRRESEVAFKRAKRAEARAAPTKAIEVRGAKC